MGIHWIENERIFKLDCASTSYIIAVIDDEGFVGHAYFGKRLSDHRVDYLLRTGEKPYVPSVNGRDRVCFYDSFPFEYSTHGVGDFRSPCLAVRTSSGHNACSLVYKSHSIFAGKPPLRGLPATLGSKEECTTLELQCKDLAAGLEVTLFYTVFKNFDAITRSVSIRNTGKEPLRLLRALSGCVEFDGIEYDMITLHGSWARERHIQRLPIGFGKTSISSVRGETGHQDNPFAAILSRDATQNHGEVYGFNLVYSGNFLIEAEGCQFESVRVTAGINPQGFEWVLDPGESFTSPELVLVYSDEGIGKMTRTFHDLYRDHLIRGKYRDQRRPILLNSWEAVYFDMCSEKLLQIAQAASDVGIELFVLDDGWFGHRNDDNTSLGDWTVNEDKIKGGLKAFSERIRSIGMKFGIWMEPEMVSQDSDLYRAHPDWVIQIPGREPALCRNQYVLDLSRDEIREYVYSRICDVLHSGEISYLKWDMNRQLSDIGGLCLAKERQGEMYHRYVLGLYDLLERLNRDFPDLLLETCSGGGARFDPGMLYYGPQIWCSDNTDAIERLMIQEGTAMVYPLRAIGAHVSDCPSHITGRTTTLDTRGLVAMAGTFGYELDIMKIAAEDRTQIREQIKRYRKHRDLIQSGDYYRIASYSENHAYDCWQIVSKDRKETILTYIQVTARPNHHSRRIQLKGLKPQEKYLESGSGKIYGGDVLMYAGILIENLHGDYSGKLLHLCEVSG